MKNMSHDASIVSSFANLKEKLDDYQSENAGDES
jgi:hypothetical protein